MTRSRLLYIDDDAALGRFVQHQLEQQGYEVHLATNAASGLSDLAAGGIDAVALDHYVSGQDGLRTLAAILALADPPPVICVAGTSESRVAVAALKAGAADYLVKDIGGDFIELLEAAIRSAMARVKLRREKVAAEQEIRTARDRFETLAAERLVLMREVDHRVGNSLQLVAAFLHMQASSSASPETRAALAEANRRVLAIAQVHQRLHESDGATSVALDSYLRQLIEEIRLSTDAKGIGDLLSFDAEPTTTDGDTATAVGIAVIELVMNAMKHAYPDSLGPVSVTLKAHGTAGYFRLCVEDRGIGMQERSAFSPGLGLTIVSAMASKLDSSIRFEAGHPGTRASLEFDVSATRGAVFAA